MTQVAMENVEQILLKFFGKNKEQQNEFFIQKLRHYWPEVIGSVNARHGQALKIERRVLYIKTDSSDWSSQFLMLKQVIVQKVNQFLHTPAVKDIRLVSGRLKNYQRLPENTRLVKSQGPEAETSLPALPELSAEEEKQALALLPSFSDAKLAERAAQVQLQRAKLKKRWRQSRQKTCVSCGAYIFTEADLCPLCARQKEQEERTLLARELRSRPWLKYEDLSKERKCDKILFSAVKDSLKAFYFEKVRTDTASLQEEQIAVLLQSGKNPQDLQEQEYANIVSFLRGKKNVRTSGHQLHHSQR